MGEIWLCPEKVKKSLEKHFEVFLKIVRGLSENI